MAIKRIPIIFCIDVEPDARKINQSSDWVGFEKSFDFFQNLRPQLAKATGMPVHFAWFMRMDPQIAHVYGSADWGVNRYRHLIDQLEEQGDEIGLHLHAWRWDEQIHDWVADFGNPEWIDHSIRSSFQTFEESFNKKCRSFRFGDHWMDQRSLNLLQELGVKFDLTLEPGQAAPTLLPNERFTGSFPDCMHMLQEPYRPHRNDFTKRGILRKQKIWIIPVSSEQPNNSTPGPATESTGHASSKRDETFVTLNLAFARTIFSTIFDKLLARLRKPFLVIVARSDVAVVPEERVNLETNVDYLLSHPLIDRFVCATPAGAMKLL